LRELLSQLGVIYLKPTRSRGLPSLIPNTVRERRFAPCVRRRRRACRTRSPPPTAPARPRTASPTSAPRHCPTPPPAREPHATPQTPRELGVGFGPRFGLGSAKLITPVSRTKELKKKRRGSIRVSTTTVVGSWLPSEQRSYSAPVGSQSYPQCREGEGFWAEAAPERGCPGCPGRAAWSPARLWTPCSWCPVQTPPAIQFNRDFSWVCRNHYNSIGVNVNGFLKTQ
jgi:hypothetical protein